MCNEGSHQQQQPKGGKLCHFSQFAIFCQKSCNENRTRARRHATNGYHVRQYARQTNDDETLSGCPGSFFPLFPVRQRLSIVCFRPVEKCSGYWTSSKHPFHFEHTERTTLLWKSAKCSNSWLLKNRSGANRSTYDGPSEKKCVHRELANWRVNPCYCVCTVKNRAVRCIYESES